MSLNFERSLVSPVEKLLIFRESKHFFFFLSQVLFVQRLLEPIELIYRPTQMKLLYLNSYVAVFGQ